jgi:hypothetical protein
MLPSDPSTSVNRATSIAGQIPCSAGKLGHLRGNLGQDLPA